MVVKPVSRHGIIALCLIIVIRAAHALTLPAVASGIDAKARTVVWSESHDPHYDLAREIFHAEGLALTGALDAALAYDLEFLNWVVAPERLSAEAFIDLGAALLRHVRSTSRSASDVQGLPG
jgi:hypothetical protein